MISIYVSLWLFVNVICCFGNVQKLNKSDATILESINFTSVQSPSNPVTELINLDNNNTSNVSQNNFNEEGVKNGNNVTVHNVTHQLNNSLTENESTINGSNSTAVNNAKFNKSSGENMDSDSLNNEQQDVNPRKLEIMKSLHSNIDDLLRVDRQRRALRYKRDSNYDDLMALMNYLEANGAELSERKSPNSNREYFGKFGDDESPSIFADEDIYEPIDTVSDQGNYGTANLQDLAYFYSPRVSESGNTYQWDPYYSRNSETYQYPQSKMRRSNYYARMPFAVFAGQRRKRKGIFRENSGYGRWGNFEKRAPQMYDNDVNEVSKIYSLASLLGDRYYPQSLRRKRSPTSSMHQNRHLYPM